MSNIALGPELKPEKVTAICPMCGKTHTRKIKDGETFFAWTGRTVPRVNCSECIYALYREGYSEWDEPPWQEYDQQRRREPVFE